MSAYFIQFAHPRYICYFHVSPVGWIVVSNRRPAAKANTVVTIRHRRPFLLGPRLGMARKASMYSKNMDFNYRTHRMIGNGLLLVTNEHTR